MKAIGIVGGVGPSAGIDLASKVFSHTKANRDQDHINLFLTSCPSLIPDRTEYLLNGGKDPAPGLEKCIAYLAQCGATAVGVSCNTAHAPQIMGRVRVPEGVKLLNMIRETSTFVSKVFGPEAKVGLLATLGTIRCNVYDKYFDNIVKPDEEVAKAVHQAIYDKEYGIKACSGVSDRAREVVSSAVEHLKGKGCSVVILGCTELPLVFNGKRSYKGTDLVDPTEILAIALIRETEPEKLALDNEMLCKLDGHKNPC